MTRIGRLKSAFGCGLQRRQIVPNCIPDGLDFDIVLLVPKPIADSTDFTLWNAGTKDLCFVLQPDGRFTDDEHLALNGSLSFDVTAISLKVHPNNEMLYVHDALENDV